MSAGIKRMLAEREAVAQGRQLQPLGLCRNASRLARLFEQRRKLVERQWNERIDVERDRVFALIETAAPYIDANYLIRPQGWPPSTLLKLIFWTIRTGPNPDNSFAALNYIERMLHLARERRAAGLDPNPFDRTGEA